MSKKRKNEESQTSNKKLKDTEESQNNAPKPKFHKGNILKITMHNFMTYDDCMFEPGAGLNLVLGPNGTGKSSIVSAICVGLCGNPKLLGRATKVMDYIKHGRDSCFVEIDLCDDNDQVVTIKRSWKKGREVSDWHVNGKSAKLEAVKKIVTNFNIKLDNLTQFLPQDRVAEFAGLGPIDLLRKTEEAVLPPEICKYHDDLVDIQKNHLDEQSKINNFQETLNILRKKNELIEKDVQKFRERQQHLLKLEQLTVKRAFVVFTQTQQEAKDIKKEKDNAEIEFEKYKAELKPLADQIASKKKEISELEKKKEQEKSQSKKLSNIEGTMGKLNNAQNKKQQFVQELASIKKRKKEREIKKQRTEKKN